MIQRSFVRSGVVEQFDRRQCQHLDRVLDAVRHYYRDLHRTEPRFDHPLSLSILTQLTHRSGSAVLNAVRILANSVGPGEAHPPLFYDRVATRKGVRRPYRIFLRSDPGTSKP